MDDLLEWVSDNLKSGTPVTDITKDFSDGTILMELLVLLVQDEALITSTFANFVSQPSSMCESLENLSAVLTCLREDGLHLQCKPLDLFRGRCDVIVELLECIRTHYHSTSLTKREISEWARSVHQHTTERRLKEDGGAVDSDRTSDRDTGLPSSNGSAEDSPHHSPDYGPSPTEGAVAAGAEGPEGGSIPERPVDESYSNVDIIEIDEELVRADSKITLSHESTRKACVYVSISMKYEVTDKAARDSFLRQAAKNYVFSGCEIPARELNRLCLGYLNVLVTCSFVKSLRNKSVGIYSPILLGFQTINVAESRQLFAHVLRGRVRLSVVLRSRDHLKLCLKNTSGTKISVCIPEGSVWQQAQNNGDSHVVTVEGVERVLYSEEEETLSLPYLFLNKHGGREPRDQVLHLTPFLFRGPLSDQDRVFGYCDPGDNGYCRFCQDCNGVIYHDMYGISYYKGRPYHLSCGPACAKCALPCFLPIISEEDGLPYCCLECLHLVRPGTYCERCGYVLTSARDRSHRRCPKHCKICGMLCLEEGERFGGSVCSQLCLDWDTSKNRICQGCAMPIVHRSTSLTLDGMHFHSVACYHLRSTGPSALLQRAMVRGKANEAQELRRLCKLEFEKRAERRRETLRLKKEERERKGALEDVMSCISKIEQSARVRAHSAATESSNHTTKSATRKRTNTRPPRRDSHSDTGSFLDLLLSSGDEEDRPVCFTRSASERRASTGTARFERKKLNRGFKTGIRDPTVAPPPKRTLTRSGHVVWVSETRKRRSVLTLRKSESQSSTTPSPVTTPSPTPSTPTIEFERPSLFEQLRCEQAISSGRGIGRYGRQYSAPERSSGRSRNVGSFGSLLTADIKQSTRSEPASPANNTSLAPVQRAQAASTQPAQPVQRAQAASTQPAPAAPYRRMTDAQIRYERRFRKNRSSESAAGKARNAVSESESTKSGEGRAGAEGVGGGEEGGGGRVPVKKISCGTITGYSLEILNPEPWPDTIILPGTTDKMEVNEPEPAVGRRLSDLGDSVRDLMITPLDSDEHLPVTLPARVSTPLEQVLTSRNSEV